MIHQERLGPVVRLTIDRPRRRNAVDHDTVIQLGDAVAGVVAERGIDPAAAPRVIVLTGTAGHFCAGADLTTVESDGFRRDLRALLESLRAAPVPVMAAISGSCLGAGLQLAAASDLRVATADAVFGVPAAKLGLMVDHWTVRRVAEAVGASTARAVLLAAETIDGERAYELGLVHRRGELGEAVEWAQAVAALAPLSHEGHKQSLNALDGDDPAAGTGDDMLDRVWNSADLAEGLAAFSERRPTQFEGH